MLTTLSYRWNKVFNLLRHSRQLQGLTVSYMVTVTDRRCPLANVFETSFCQQQVLTSLNMTLLAFNRWRTVVSGAWKYDDPRLKCHTRAHEVFCRLTKMVTWEFFLQDGGVSEGFTHKMAACEFCLQDGDNAAFLRVLPTIWRCGGVLPTRWRQCKTNKT